MPYLSFLHSLRDLAHTVAEKLPGTCMSYSDVQNIQNINSGHFDEHGKTERDPDSSVRITGHRKTEIETDSSKSISTTSMVYRIYLTLF